jgi:predicted DNA-binding transcriptional regulator AlpA
MCANRPDRAVREPEREQITGVPTSSWYALQARGLVPKPFSLTGSRAVGWSFNELADWVEARKATRADTWQSLGNAAARVVEKLGKSRR